MNDWKQFEELSPLFDTLSEVMESDYVGGWLKPPNEVFDDSPPLRVIEPADDSPDRYWPTVMSSFCLQPSSYYLS